MTATTQALDALAYGQRVRLARAALRANVEALDHRDGRERVAELLDDPPPELASAAVLTLLGWIHRVGSYQARRFLASLTLPVSEMRPVRELTERQRHEIADRLRKDGSL